MNINLTNDSMYPISIDDSWGDPIYINKDIIENDQEWAHFMSELNTTRIMYLTKQKKER